MNGIFYSKYSKYWQLFSPKEHYKEEAAQYVKVLKNAFPGLKSVLELGSGGGNNAHYLKEHFRMTLSDISPGMLSESRKINPECEHLLGDMRTLRLKRKFDAVLIADAVMYLTTAPDVIRALKTAFLHLQRSGVLLIVPDLFIEDFRDRIEKRTNRRKDRSLTYIEVDHHPHRNDSEFTADFFFILKKGCTVENVFRDTHRMGVFSRKEWEGFFKKAGFRNIKFICLSNKKDTQGNTGILAEK